MGVKTLRVMVILTPTLRPRRAEQDSVGLPMDVTPQRDARRRRSACYCAPTRSHPVNGSLLHAPAHLSPRAGRGNTAFAASGEYTPSPAGAGEGCGEGGVSSDAATHGCQALSQS